MLLLGLKKLKETNLRFPRACVSPVYHCISVTQLRTSHTTGAKHILEEKQKPLNKQIIVTFPNLCRQVEHLRLENPSS